MSDLTDIAAETRRRIEANKGKYVRTYSNEDLGKSDAWNSPYEPLKSNDISGMLGIEAPHQPANPDAQPGDPDFDWDHYAEWRAKHPNPEIAAKEFLARPDVLGPLGGMQADTADEYRSRHNPNVFEDPVGNAIAAVASIPGGLKDAGKAAITAPFQLAGDFLQHGLESHRNASAAEYEKAAHETNPIGAAAHYIAGTVPLVGPMASAIGEQIGTGEGEKMGHGIGEAGGVILAPEAGKLALKGARIATPYVGTGIVKAGELTETAGKVAARPANYGAAGAMAGGHPITAASVLAAPPALRGIGRGMQRLGNWMKSMGPAEAPGITGAEIYNDALARTASKDMPPFPGTPRSSWEMPYRGPSGAPSTAIPPTYGMQPKPTVGNGPFYQGQGDFYDAARINQEAGNVAGRYNSQNPDPRFDVLNTPTWEPQRSADVDATFQALKDQLAVKRQPNYHGDMEEDFGSAPGDQELIDRAALLAKHAETTGEAPRTTMTPERSTVTIEPEVKESSTKDSAAVSAADRAKRITASLGGRGRAIPRLDEQWGPGSKTKSGELAVLGETVGNEMLIDPQIPTAEIRAKLAKETDPTMREFLTRALRQRAYIDRDAIDKALGAK